MRFNVQDEYLIKYSSVETYTANRFLEMFPDDEWSFSGLKHLTEKLTVVASLTHMRVVVDHILPT